MATYRHPDPLAGTDLAEIRAAIARIERAIAPAPEYETVRAAARRLGCHPVTIRRGIAAGRITSMRAGRRVLVRIDGAAR